MNKIGVICGNKMEFKKYLEKEVSRSDRKNYVQIMSIKNIRGLFFSEIEIIGTGRELNNFEGLRMMASDRIRK